MKTFAEYEQEFFSLLKSENLNLEKYFAHTRNNGDTKELLSQHTNMVLKYFIALCDANNLESVIDDSISKYVANANYINKEEVVDIIKSFFLSAVYSHDFGKVNENFQISKMGNDSFNNIKNGIDTQHSVLSAYLFISFEFYSVLNSNLGSKDKNLLLAMVLLFAYPILKHHSLLMNGTDARFKDGILEYLSEYRTIFSSVIPLNKQVNNFLHITNYLELMKGELEISFEVFFLLKLNFSLLTASDYYATNEFMNSMAINNFGVMNEKLKQKIIVNAYNIPYNKELSKNFSFYNSQNFEELKSFSSSNLNKLRQKLVAEVITNLRANISQKLFYIEAPTGAGKTNLSLLALTEILKQRNDISKIFYVFPYTTIITQTYKSFCSSLDLDYSEIAEIHSKASFKVNQADGNEKDAHYDSEWRNYIDNLFVNYPFVLLSHVKFFDILTSNEKSVNYLLHRIANSVVIIDELQSYSPSEWDKVNYLLQKYSEVMNITFIVMSATLPKISKLFLCKNISIDKFVYLVKNKNEYFSNPNFRERIKIRLDYLNEGKDLNRLAGIVFQHSEEYFNRHNYVKSIIEFITKTNARNFYDKIIKNEQMFCDYEIYFITGTILEPRRKEIISYLKSDESKDKKVLVICTQVIEAGLDIDMDIGFKDRAILDSEEQLAGRINRNASKTDSELFIFNTGDRSKVYGKDLRYQQITDELYLEVISGRNYDMLYEKVFDNINRSNDNPFLANNLSDFVDQIRSLRFAGVKDKFCLIKDNSISVYVPCEVEKEHFNSAEINFLLQCNYEICNSKTIDGELVWNIYESIVTNKRDGFNYKIDLKIISSLMSKFTFNVWRNPDTINLILQRSDEGELKYGFIKLSKEYYTEIYSYETGLKTDLETDVNIL